MTRASLCGMACRICRVVTTIGGSGPPYRCNSKARWRTGTSGARSRLRHAWHALTAYRAALMCGCCVRYTGVKATFLSMLDAVGDAEERMEAAQDSVSEAALVLCVLRLTCGYPPPSASSALHST